MAEQQEFTVEAAALRPTLVTAIGFSSSSDYDPPVIRAVKIAATDGAVEFAATDRYVMYYEPIKATGQPFDTLMPRDIAKRLISLIPRATRKQPIEGLVSFAQDGDRVTVKYVGEYDSTVTFTPADGKFPEYRDMVAKADADDGEPVAPSIHFSPKMVARVCSAINGRGYTGEPINMRFRSATKPLVITHGGLYALIMPVRVSEDSK